MSTQVFPSLPGLTFPVTRTPLWSTQVQESTSGKELRLAYYTYPRYRWQVKISVLRSDSTNHELQTLLGFFNARQGQFDTFLYTDADDNTVTTQAIATGDGTTSAFQLVRTLGSFTEPVLAPNAVSAVYLAGVSIPSAGYSAPTNGALTQTAAGALGSTTYYVRSTWVTNGGETVGATETNLAVSANNVLNVAAPGSAPAGAIGWNVYVSNTAGGGSGHETKQNGGTPIALGTPWVEPTSGLVAGAALPGSNTTGWSVTGWGTSTPGILTFGAAVQNSIAITADFTYYWPCRFLQDNAAFDLFLTSMYEVKTLAWESVKN